MEISFPVTDQSLTVIRDESPYCSACNKNTTMHRNTTMDLLAVFSAWKFMVLSSKDSVDQDKGKGEC
jgi:hypothetical protein